MIKNNDRRTFFNLLITYLFLFLIWTLFSFVFTDPNLTLINRQAFIACQNFLWQNILPNTYLRVGTYLTLTGALMINYLYLIKFWPKKTYASSISIMRCFPPTPDGTHPLGSYLTEKKRLV